MIVKNSPEIDRFRRGDLVLYNINSRVPRKVGICLGSRARKCRAGWGAYDASIMTKDGIRYLNPVDCEIIASL